MWQVPRRLPESAAAATHQYALSHQLVSFHSSSTTSCTSAPIHHPCFHNPANAACAYYHNGSGTPTSHPVPTHLFFPVTRWFRPEFQTGRHRNDRCLRLLVRYIYMRFRPTPAEFNGATTAFLCPNWPRHTQPEHPRTHLPPHHQPPEPRLPSFCDYQLHPRD